MMRVTVEVLNCVGASWLKGARVLGVIIVTVSMFTVNVCVTVVFVTVRINKFSVFFYVFGT